MIINVGRSSLKLLDTLRYIHIEKGNPCQDCCQSAKAISRNKTPLAFVL